MNDDHYDLIKLFELEIVSARLRCFNRIHDAIIFSSSELTPDTISRVVTESFRTYLKDLNKLQEWFLSDSEENNSIVYFYKTIT